MNSRCNSRQKGWFGPVIAVLIFGNTGVSHVTGSERGFVGFAPPSSSMQEADRQEEAPPFDRESYFESFDKVWQTVADTHWDREMIAELWTPLRATYRDKMSAATSSDEAVAILNEMLRELGQSHFGIIPASDYSEIAEQAESGGPGYSGITVRWIENQLLVTAVAIGSPGAEAGVRPGWSLRSVTNPEDGKTKVVSDFESKVEKAVKHTPVRKETGMALAGENLMSGKVGEVRIFNFVDLDDKPIAVEVTLAEGPGKATTLGNLPTIHLETSSTHTGDGIAIYRFNAFLDAPRLAREFESLLKDPRTTRGLVIDLRGNMGGLVILTMGLSGWLVDEPSELGTMTMGTTPLKLRLNPRDPSFDLPVAVLTDECSISAAELLAGGLQDLGAARVFGARTAGLVLPSNVSRLPTGEGFQYAMADYKSASGRSLELDGVTPDVPVTLTRSVLATGKDAVMDAATNYIRESTK